MLQVIFNSVTGIDDSQMDLLDFSYSDESSVWCEAKCPFILLLRRDPLKKFWNILKM